MGLSVLSSSTKPVDLEEKMENSKMRASRKIARFVQNAEVYSVSGSSTMRIKSINRMTAHIEHRIPVHATINPLSIDFFCALAADSRQSDLKN